MWLFSSVDGHVYRTDLFNYNNVVAKLTKKTEKDELVAVFKKPGFINGEMGGNDITLITSRDMYITT